MLIVINLIIAVQLIVNTVDSDGSGSTLSIFLNRFAPPNLPKQFNSMVSQMIPIFPQEPVKMLVEEQGKCGQPYVVHWPAFSNRPPHIFYTWIASLIKEGVQICSGVLIRSGEGFNESTLITTSATCADEKPTEAVFQIPLAGVITQIRRVIIDWMPYRLWKKHHGRRTGVETPLGCNIALLTMDTAIAFSEYLSPICVPQLGEIFPQYQTGIVSVKDTNAPNRIFELSVREIDISKCMDEYQDNRIHEAMCIGGIEESKRWSYQIRLGGAFFVKSERGYVLRAISSYGTRPTASVFTDVVHFIETGCGRSQLDELKTAVKEAAKDAAKKTFKNTMRTVSNFKDQIMKKN